MAPRCKEWLPWALLATWLGGTAAAFWWFDGQYRRPFAQDLGAFGELQSNAVVPDGLRAALHAGGDTLPVTLVHFRDSDCPCTRFNRPHAAAISEQYGRAGVRVLVVDATRDVAAPAAGLDAQLSDWLPVPASPAALVIDADGQIAYFGPYSAGAGCITGTGTFVERALERALRGEAETQLNVLNVGCYCAWPTRTAANAHVSGGERT